MGFLQDISNYWTKQLDPRVADLPLISPSYQVPLIIFAYLYFVLSCGPRFMKNRQPYSLKMFMKLYNVVQILGNVWLMWDMIDAGLFANNLICSVFDYSYDYIPLRLTRCIWYYFLLKILDYTETVVFVLRKKNNQISTLHLYHHVSTLFLTWVGVRYYAVAAVIFTSFINCFIHVIMYTYYFLATWGPIVQKAVAPMKRWITITQMAQFIVFILYASYQFLVGCKIINDSIILTFVVNVVINLYLFRNFYRKEYKELKNT